MSARKRVRAFLNAPSTQPDSTTAQAAQRNHDAYLRERAENQILRDTVSELSRKIQDPPGSHERWQELRQKNTSLAAQRDSLQTSLLRAETQIRTQANTIDSQDRKVRELAAELSACRAANTQSLRERDEARAARRATDSYKESLEKALRATRAELNALRDTDFKKMYETARAEAVRLQQEVDRQARLLQGAHKDAERLRAEVVRERENATRLAKKLDAARPDILRDARPKDGHWSTEYFLGLMQAVAESLKEEEK